MKKTVILGATDNPSRYAYTAAAMMDSRGVDFVPVGIKKGVVFGRDILDLNHRPPISEVETITLYIGAQNQPEWYEYILSLHPKRLIFNPGTENPELEKLAREKGIEVWPACTMVLLSSGQY